MNTDKDGLCSWRHTTKTKKKENPKEDDRSVLLLGLPCVFGAGVCVWLGLARAVVSSAFHPSMHGWGTDFGLI